MQAWTATGQGSLRLAEVDESEPRPNEAVVAVEAFSPNRGESFVLERAESGFRPGKDIAGVIVKPAASGHGPGIGDRVVAHLDHSGWAERAVVPIDRLAVVPEAISSTATVLTKLTGHGLLVWFGQASRTAPTLDFFDWTGGSSATTRKFLYTDDDATDDDAPVADDLATLVRLTATGRLHPEIGVVAGWEDTPRIIEAMVARTVRGNAVLTIPSHQTTVPHRHHEPMSDRNSA